MLKVSLWHDTTQIKSALVICIMSIAELYKTESLEILLVFCIVFILPNLRRRRKSKLSLTISKQWCTTEYFKWITIIIRFFVFFCLSRNYKTRNCRYFDILHTKCLDARYLSSAKESILKQNPISIEIHTHCTKACTLAKNEEAKLYM